MAKITYSLIYNRKDQLNSKGLALIQLRVYFPDVRENRYVSTGVYVAPGQWDDEKWVVNHGEADDLNFLLTLNGKFD